MKLTDIHLDGFGVWHDLRLEKLSPRLTAFYGPNEAGKTTLMQFVRGVLYGMSPERRKRYLPPIHGGRPGGALGIVDQGERFVVGRLAERGPDDLGLVSITNAEGHASGDRMLREALSEIDERTFNNVFAMGLSEIQQLGTLSDTKAAEWLYRLTSGLDRVSLYDVIINLRSTREGLLSASDVDSKISQLISRKEQLRGEIQQLVQRNRQWAQLAVQIEELDEQIAAAEAAVRECEHRSRTIEIAVGIKSSWRKRAKLTAHLQQHASEVQLPADALDQLVELNGKIEHHQREADILAGQRRQLREEKERLGINELLLKTTCRIDALAEQRDWLAALERQIDHLEHEADHFEQQLASEQHRLGHTLGFKDEKQLAVLSAADLESLEPLVEELRSAQTLVEKAQRALERLSESERSFQAQIETATVAGEQHGLPMDINEASDLVAKLRRRLQVEQRLEQARQHERELEAQSHDLLDDQVMPLSVFNWSLAAVILGGLLMGTWLWVPNSPLGSAGGLIAAGAIGVASFCFVFKYFTEDAAAEKLDACQRQMEVVVRQIEEAQEETTRLNGELPITDGSALLRLQAAERHLAELETVLPVEAQRKQAGHEVASAAARKEQADRQMAEVLKSWRGKLAGLGFSAELDPQVFLSVIERFTALGDLEQRARLRREDASARRREYAMLTRRVNDLATEVDCVLVGEETEIGDDGVEYEIEASTLDQLEHLVAECKRQAIDVQRRSELFDKARELKTNEGKHRRTVAGIKRRLSATFLAAGCDDETTYRQLFEEQQQLERMRRQRKALAREIAAAIGQQAPEEVFEELLRRENAELLDGKWETISTELDALQEELKSLVDQRGALRQQQRTLAEDRTLAERQLELGCVEKQLAEARQSWREHATVNRVLERIRDHYERHRQPETLAEATRYLQQLTGGEYVRVWTPLADDVLLVDNSAGESLSADVLSRGTREQLFLSVRLALVSTFARRGIQLPMVLDDVLVNFDAVRAQRAAEMLLEFAAGGHQLLVFTCHEHVWQMFQKLDADCRRLPSRQASIVQVEILEDVPEEPAIEIEEVVEEVAEEVPAPIVEPKRLRRVKPAPQPVVEQIAPPTAEEFYDYPFSERIEREVVETGALAYVVPDYLEPRRA